MRSVDDAASIAAMAKGIHRVTIEIEPDEPIHGRIVDAGGTEQGFHGWLELSAALERARIGPDATSREEEQGEPGGHSHHG